MPKQAPAWPLAPQMTGEQEAQAVKNTEEEAAANASAAGDVQFAVSNK